MSHARKQIRDAVVTALAGVTPTVVPHRIWIAPQAQLPMIGVYTGSEESGLDEGASFTTIYRTLEVVLEIATSGVDGTTGMDELDGYAVEIETRLGADRSLAGMIDFYPTGLETEQSSEGDAVVSRATMTYTGMYRTTPDDPETLV